MKELRALPVNAAILNASGTIVAVNDTWKDFARQNRLRLPNFGVGLNYLQFCESGGPYPSLSAADLKELLVGRKKLLTLIYPCDSPRKKRWFSLIGLQLSPDRPAGVALLHINLTDTLPSPTGAHQGRAKIQRRRQIRTTANLKAISGTIERTVLETLSSQLNTMLSGTHHGPALNDTSANLDAEGVLAGTKLSKRQMEVLRLLGQGKSNKEIAKTLFRSPHTIKLHVSAILQQFEVEESNPSSSPCIDDVQTAFGRPAGQWHRVVEEDAHYENATQSWSLSPRKGFYRLLMRSPARAIKVPKRNTLWRPSALWGDVADERR